MAVSAEERRSRLLEMIRLRGFASLPDLASDFDVSDSTIRRDLDALEEVGAARRTHGGVFYTGPSPKLSHFDVRQSTEWERKHRIAMRAAKLVEDGETLLLDGGSTTYELARELVGRPLQIVTNSLPVANLFASSNEVDLVLIGGTVHAKTGVTLGPYANQMLATLEVQKAFLSVASANERGWFNSNLLLVETEQAMMRAAGETIVVADSTKFGRRSLAHLCDLGQIPRLVVDDGLSDAWKETLSAAGVEAILVTPTDTETADGPSAPTADGRTANGSH